MVVVRHLPDPIACIDRHRLRLERRDGRNAFVHRRREDDRLERGAGLTLGLRREVELALAEVPPAEHRPHRTRAWIDRDERGRGAIGIPKNRLDRRSRFQLEVEVDRRRDLESAAEHATGAVACDELVLHVVDEVRRRSLCAGKPDVVEDGKISLVRPLELAPGDLSLIEHHPEHVAPTQRCAPRVDRRVVERRIRRNSGEERRLGERELLRALLEVRARRLLDAVCAVAEVDRVEVRGEDPILAPALLELPGERSLAHLACERALVPDVRVLDELLRDRRAALDDALLANVLPESAPDASHVDAVVLEEALILDRDDRLSHDRCDVLGA